jgi:hypothetical protein
MCELCSRPREEWKRLKKSDGAHGCEWFDEDSDEPEVCCHGKAKWIVAYWMLEEHLCDEHTAAQNKALDQGLGLGRFPS